MRTLQVVYRRSPMDGLVSGLVSESALNPDVNSTSASALTSTSASVFNSIFNSDSNSTFNVFFDSAFNSSTKSVARLAVSLLALMATAPWVCAQAGQALPVVPAASNSNSTSALPSSAPAVLQPAPVCPAILDYRFPRLQDNVQQDLCQYAGKVVLVVNTASYCGFTSQYQGLEELYAKYGAEGLVVLGFPSNDFGKQEPGTSKQIADFCFNTYGVKFPMFSKSSVKGDSMNPLYAALVKASGTTPKWNFYKYLIDRHGHVVNSYTSLTTPNDQELLTDITKAIAKQ